jgi:hypothetical protein
MAEEKKDVIKSLGLPVGETYNDTSSHYQEVVAQYRIETDNGYETFFIFRVWHNGEIKTLINEGREFVKVLYISPNGEMIRQAFYRSTGAHIEAGIYDEARKGGYGFNTAGIWTPCDGMGYQYYLIANKRDFNMDPYENDYDEWKNSRNSNIFKCDYFGIDFAYEFGEAVDPDVGLSKYGADDSKMNKNFDLVKFGNATLARISFLLSSGEDNIDRFWTSDLGKRIIGRYNFTIDPEFQISIEKNSVDASEREINNFIAEFVSFNYNSGHKLFRSPTYLLDRRVNRPYDLRYSYLHTAKDTWVMTYEYLLTNPDSRLPDHMQSKESQLTKQIYDYFDSGIGVITKKKMRFFR